MSVFYTSNSVQTQNCLRINALYILRFFVIPSSFSSSFFPSSFSSPHPFVSSSIYHSRFPLLSLSRLPLLSLSRLPQPSPFILPFCYLCLLFRSPFPARTFTSNPSSLLHLPPLLAPPHPLHCSLILASPPSSPQGVIGFLSSTT